MTGAADMATACRDARRNHARARPPNPLQHALPKRELTRTHTHGQTTSRKHNAHTRNAWTQEMATAETLFGAGSAKQRAMTLGFANYFWGPSKTWPLPKQDQTIPNFVVARRSRGPKHLLPLLRRACAGTNALSCEKQNTSSDFP